MTTLNEAASTDAGLQAYLEADATLMAMLDGGVYSTYLRKAGDRFPLVRFFLIESEDLMVINGTRVWATLRYQVEGVSKGYDITDLRAIANRLDTLLHRLRGQTWDDVFVEEVVREQALFRRELEVDQPYAFAGGEYLSTYPERMDYLPFIATLATIATAVALWIALFQGFNSL